MRDDLFARECVAAKKQLTRQAGTEVCHAQEGFISYAGK